MPSKDPYANDTAPDWDGVTDTRWSDVYSVEELASILAIHSARAARRGDYEAATDIALGVSAILQLSDELDTALGRPITAKPL